jgi:hypothetical protein
VTRERVRRSSRTPQLGLAATWRQHPGSLARGTGLRLGLPVRVRPAPYLVAGADVAVEQLDSPLGVALGAARAGLYAGARTGLPRGGAAWLAARAELGRVSAASADPNATVALDDPWTAAVTALLGYQAPIVPALGLRVECELGATLRPVRVERTWSGPMRPPPTTINVVDGTFVIVSLGLYLP